MTGFLRGGRLKNQQISQSVRCSTLGLTERKLISSLHSLVGSEKRLTCQE